MEGLRSSVSIQVGSAPVSSNFERKYSSLGSAVYMISNILTLIYDTQFSARVCPGSHVGLFFVRTKAGQMSVFRSY